VGSFFDNAVVIGESCEEVIFYMNHVEEKVYDEEVNNDDEGKSGWENSFFVALK